MRKYLLILFIITTNISISAMDSVKVSIQVLSTKTDTAGIYIAGNQSEFGNWNPSAVMLKQINDSAYAKVFYFKTNTNIEFKFTRGSWNNEALNSEGTVLENYELKVRKDTSLVYKIHDWKDENHSVAEGGITGTVEYINNFKSRDKLLARDIIVWLPPGYDENEDRKYPVLYMHDGQNIIDPKTSFLGTDWQIDETADSLIQQNEIEPIIIVGLYNTVNRSTEYSENDTGYTYIDFLVNDIKPLIDKKYRTKPERENTAVAGSSMGGLISFMIIWERPDIFSKAACLSPALKIRKYDFVDNVISYKGKKKDILLYIDDGSGGLEDSLQTGVDEMLKALSNKGYFEGRDFIFYKDIGAPHNEAAWAKRTWRFLKLFFGKE